MSALEQVLFVAAVLKFALPVVTAILAIHHYRRANMLKAIFWAVVWFAVVVGSKGLAYAPKGCYDESIDSADVRVRLHSI